MVSGCLFACEPCKPARLRACLQADSRTSSCAEGWHLTFAAFPSTSPCLSTRSTLVHRAGDSMPFLATQLVERAVSLDEAAAAAPPTWLTTAAAAREGLRAIHAAGVAHGDVRGANCLVTPDGRAVWIDFAHAVMGASPEERAAEAAELEELLRLLRPEGPGAAINYGGMSEREVASRAPAATPTSASSEVSESSDGRSDGRGQGQSPEPEAPQAGQQRGQPGGGSG